MLLTTTPRSLVVFDLDFTLWHRPRFRAGRGPPWTVEDGGLGGVRSATGDLLYLYPASRRALLELSDAEVPVAVASRTHRGQWARQWLELLRVEPGGRTVADVVGRGPVVIRDGPKPNHLREIERQSGVPLERMLFFDDDRADVERAEAIGCTAVHVAALDRRRGRCGLTDEHFRDGMRRHAARWAAAAGDEGGAARRGTEDPCR
tara:strand:- start:205 stop:819 length:615 start_codon:yes stop_codon:yes gene_type:complete